MAAGTIEPAQLQGFGDLLLTRTRVAGDDKNRQWSIFKRFLI
jgi:hypothetical protein